MTNRTVQIRGGYLNGLSPDILFHHFHNKIAKPPIVNQGNSLVEFRTAKRAQDLVTQGFIHIETGSKKKKLFFCVWHRKTYDPKVLQQQLKQEVFVLWHTTLHCPHSKPSLV